MRKFYRYKFRVKATVEEFKCKRETKSNQKMKMKKQSEKERGSCEETLSKGDRGRRRLKDWLRAREIKSENKTQIIGYLNFNYEKDEIQ